MLGLARDGAVFPLCPGVLGGTFDKRRHEFVNLDVEDVVADVTAFVSELRAVNPEARVILTVSPVPLIATAEPRHVLVSTIASKSSESRLRKDRQGLQERRLLSLLRDRHRRLWQDLVLCRGLPLGNGRGSGACDARFMRHHVRNSGTLRNLKELVSGFTARTAPQTSEVEQIVQVVRVVCEEEALDLANLPESMKR
jgi:hypothetical protein